MRYRPHWRLHLFLTASRVMKASSPTSRGPRSPQRPGGASRAIAALLTFFRPPITVVCGRATPSLKPNEGKKLTSSSYFNINNSKRQRMDVLKSQCTFLRWPIPGYCRGPPSKVHLRKWQRPPLPRFPPLPPHPLPPPAKIENRKMETSVR